MPLSFFSFRFDILRGGMCMVDNVKVQRLQENLYIIRIVAGYSSAEFASEIGVTRQSVNFWESGKSHMSGLHCLAIWKLTDIIIEEDTNMLLSACWNELIDYSEGDEESREKLKTAIYSLIGKNRTMKPRDLSMILRQEVCV